MPFSRSDRVGSRRTGSWASLTTDLRFLGLQLTLAAPLTGSVCENGKSQSTNVILKHTTTLNTRGIVNKNAPAAAATRPASSRLYFAKLATLHNHRPIQADRIYAVDELLHVCPVLVLQALLAT